MNNDITICAGCEQDLDTLGAGSLIAFVPAAGGTSYIYPICRCCEDVAVQMTEAEQLAHADLASMRVELAPAKHGALAVPAGVDPLIAVVRAARFFESKSMRVNHDAQKID